MRPLLSSRLIVRTTKLFSSANPPTTDIACRSTKKTKTLLNNNLHRQQQLISCLIFKEWYLHRGWVSGSFDGNANLCCIIVQPFKIQKYAICNYTFFYFNFYKDFFSFIAPWLHYLDHYFVGDFSCFCFVFISLQFWPVPISVYIVPCTFNSSGCFHVTNTYCAHKKNFVLWWCSAFAIIASGMEKKSISLRSELLIHHTIPNSQAPNMKRLWHTQKDVKIQRETSIVGAFDISAKWINLINRSSRWQK